MQGERLPVPDSPHKMLIYSSGNCRLLICPTRKKKHLSATAALCFTVALTPWIHSSSISPTFSSPLFDPLLHNLFPSNTLTKKEKKKKAQLLEIITTFGMPMCNCIFVFRPQQFAMTKCNVLDCLFEIYMQTFSQSSFKRLALPVLMFFL